MLYGKLAVALLTTLAAEKNQSTNQYIAQYILNHREALADTSIKELAAGCGVGTASISRFCRDIGLSDFGELRKLIAEIPGMGPVDTGLSYEQRLLKLEHERAETLFSAAEALAVPRTRHQIDRLCEDIYRYSRVAAFGMLKSESVAFNFQSEMLGYGKVIFTTISYKQQIEYIEQMTGEDLLIIFSNRGVYFEYQYPDGLPEWLERPKIYLITTTERKYPRCIDDVICIPSGGTVVHPYHMQMVADMIAGEYAAKNYT